MRIPDENGSHVVTMKDLLPVLQNCLEVFLGGTRRILSVVRRPSEYRSSYAIEELTVELADGATLSIMFKNLSRAALTETARDAKPRFLYDPLREILLNQKVLREVAPGTAACFGTVADQQQDRFWLFLESVPGVELYMVGELAVWRHVARWLARFHQHASLVLPALQPEVRRHLLHYDGDYYRQWIMRALQFTRLDGPGKQVAALRHIANRYDRVIGHLTSLPATLVHGDFYASNVLVESAVEPGRVAPIDWELSGLGAGLLDLAALTAGNWRPEEQSSFALSYFEELNSQTSVDAPRSAEFESFQTSLSYCRLQLAIQWLGWSPTWAPPTAHAHDWLSEALRVANELGF